MSHEEDHIIKMMSLRVDDATSNVLPLSPTAKAILELQSQIDDLHRTLNKLIRVLRNFDIENNRALEEVFARLEELRCSK